MLDVSNETLVFLVHFLNHSQYYQWQVCANIMKYMHQNTGCSEKGNRFFYYVYLGAVYMLFCFVLFL